MYIQECSFVVEIELISHAGAALANLMFFNRHIERYLERKKIGTEVLGAVQHWQPARFSTWPAQCYSGGKQK